MGKLIELLKQSSPLGDGDYFHINLSSRHRPVLAPLRLLLIGSCVLLTLSIVWSLAQAVLAYQECWAIEAELERVRQQDSQLVAEAGREGIDLSEGALRRLPAEIDLANQLPSAGQVAVVDVQVA